mmetsp:Transcript_22341/g.67121  ORF Transcript_22341/g.67121 Transcript_22341/m.67121 type:complete len:270 (+) Transcript_22341:665-1474(+)
MQAATKVSPAPTESTTLSSFRAAWKCACPVAQSSANAPSEPQGQIHSALQASPTQARSPRRHRSARCSSASPPREPSTPARFSSSRCLSTNSREKYARSQSSSSGTSCSGCIPGFSTSSETIGRVCVSDAQACTASAMCSTSGIMRHSKCTQHTLPRSAAWQGVLRRLRAKWPASSSRRPLRCEMMVREPVSMDLIMKALGCPASPPTSSISEVSTPQLFRSASAKAVSGSSARGTAPTQLTQQPTCAAVRRSAKTTEELAALPPRDRL